MVYVRRGDGQSEKRKVAIGQKTDQKWEVFEGLKEGDEILLKKPDASKADRSGCIKSLPSTKKDDMRYYFSARCRGARAVAYCLAVLTTCVPACRSVHIRVGPTDGPGESSTSEPNAPWLQDVPKPPSVPTPAPADIQQAIDRGIEFLLEDQNKDGSWGTPERTKDLNIFAPVPGAHHAFRTAVTSLCLCGLIEIGSQQPGGTASDRSRRSLDDGEPAATATRRSGGDLQRVGTRLRRSRPWCACISATPDDPTRQKEIVALLRIAVRLSGSLRVRRWWLGLLRLSRRHQETGHRLDQLLVGRRAGRLPRSTGDRCYRRRKS